MGKKVRSAKGELVDFDFLRIKEQLASAPTPMEVKTRQNFIENRLKRRLKKKLPVIEKAVVEVEPKLPEPEENIEVEEKLTVKAVTETPKPVTKQKARARKKKEE